VDPRKPVLWAVVMWAASHRNKNKRLSMERFRRCIEGNIVSCLSLIMLLLDREHIRSIRNSEICDRGVAPKMQFGTLGTFQVYVSKWIYDSRGALTVKDAREVL
jgi:hypothetical protein